MTTPAEQALDSAAAKALAAAHILPSTFRAAVTHVDEQHQEYRRAAYVIESRTVQLGVATAHGTKKAQITPRPDPTRVDPWQVDPRTLADTTRTVALCPGCEGTKKRTCSPCGGVGQLRCGECGGAGRVMGQRGLKNCPSCRGNGTRRCTGCNGKGQTKCEPCEGLGRVRAWLELETDRRTEVLAHPRSGPAVLHGGLLQAQDVEREPSLFPFPLVSDTGWGLAMPSGLDPELIVTIDPFTDRIAARRLQVFRATVFHCHYRIPTGSGVVQLAGHPPQILPESQWAPWRRRSLVSLAAGGLGDFVHEVYEALGAPEGGAASANTVSARTRSTKSPRISTIWASRSSTSTTSSAGVAAERIYAIAKGGPGRRARSPRQSFIATDRGRDSRGRGLV